MEEEAENIRKSIIAALQKMTQFMESMRDTAHRIGTVLALESLWIIVRSFSRRIGSTENRLSDGHFRSCNRGTGRRRDRRREEEGAVSLRGVARRFSRTGEDGDGVRRDGDPQQTVRTEAAAEGSHDYEVASSRCMHSVREHTRLRGLEVTQLLGEGQGGAGDLGATAAALRATGPRFPQPRVFYTHHLQQSS